ncbi:hypothetical protein [Rathayibacter sp. VKM Ac-2630]|uniref:hypothetical protein n=1 Tax=Rathayibacter sp. VKM Ac-2630 TaxID=1938617 RepID=UPI0009824E4B|nr:hypothetical protein [Rathayibacter sp. VKM Ac-2630]OOB90997.1 hypothetical protein B0T42_08535 [Rathayibacter sp. VKM Ac-2630]
MSPVAVPSAPSGGSRGVRLPVWRSERRGADLDEARDFYQRGYNGSGFRAERTTTPFEYRYASTGGGPVSLHSASFLGRVRGTVDPAGVYVVLWLTQGRASVDLGRDENRLVVGRPAMFPTGRPFGFEAHEYRDALVHFDAPTSSAPPQSCTAASPARSASLPWRATRLPGGSPCADSATRSPSRRPPPSCSATPRRGSPPRRLCAPSPTGSCRCPSLRRR